MNQLEILLKLRNETAAGFAQLEKSVESVKKQTDGLTTSTAATAGGMSNMAKSALVAVGGLTAVAAAAAVVVSGTREMLGEFAKAGSHLVDLKNKTGVGVVEMQKLQFAAKQSGVEFGSLTTALIQMEKAASKSPEKFAQLGISFEQIKNSKPDQLMALVADGLNNVSDQNEKARIAMELFGRGGSEVLKMMTSDFRGLLTEAESMGLMTEEMAAKGDRLDDTFSKLDEVTKNLKINLAAAFASPEMISVMGQMADLIGLMAQNADKLAFAIKTVAGSSFGVASFLIGPAMSALSGPEMPDFSGVKGGRSSSTDPVHDTIAGNASKVLAAAAADEKRAAAEALRAAKAADEALADMVRDRWKDQQSLYEAMVKKNEAALPFIERAAFASIPSTLSVPTDAYGKPKQYSFDNSTNYAGITKGSFDAGKALQTFAHIAELSSSKLGKSISSIAGGLAGVLAGKDSMSGLGGGVMGILGKISGVGSIISAGLGIFSGIKSLFGGGGKEKKERAAAAAQAAADQAAEDQRRRAAGLSTAAGGLNAFARGGGITDQGSADRAGMYAGAIFGGQVKENGDVVGALKSIGPALSEMASKAKELGLNLGAGISNLLGMNAVISGNEGLADQLSGLNQMMKGLGDAGMITKDMFTAFGADASAVFARLIEGGATGNQALSLMQPTLQQLYEGQKLHGYAVDETTQGLIDQAKAEGIVGDAFMSANERIVELLGILIEAVGGQLPESYRRAGDAAEEYARRASNLPGPPGGGYTGDNPGDGSGPGFASGTAFRNFGRGTQAMLHGEEAVLTRPQVDRLVSMAVSGAPGSTVPQGGGQPIVVHVVMDGQIVATALTNTLEAEGPEAQRFRQASAGR